MTRSLALWLYLILARRRRPGTAGAAPPALPAPAESGPLLWFHAGEAAALPALAHLARQMTARRPGLRFAVTAPDKAPDLAGFPGASLSLAQPADRLPALHDLLARLCPSLVLLTGLALPPGLIHAARSRGVPVALADVHLSAGARAPWRWPRRMAAALFQRLDLVLARDGDSLEALVRLLRRPVAAEVTGRIEETTEPLSHSEAERAALAELMKARPVWLAAACPVDEEVAVIGAHLRALRHAHRLLLILSPADPKRGPALAERLAAEGMGVSLRSRDEDPEDEVQVLVADTEAEMGLWYRMAPVTYMGGTLGGSGAGRNPMEPAALGSAILHGPRHGPYPEAYAGLAAAYAARAIADAAGLAEAVTELIAPDKAAFLAHNAWAASSGGAEVTERVMELLFRRIDAAVDTKVAQPAAKAQRPAAKAPGRRPARGGKVEPPPGRPEGDATGAGPAEAEAPGVGREARADKRAGG